MPRDADKVLRNLNRQLVAMGMQPMKVKEIKQILDQIDKSKVQSGIPDVVDPGAKGTFEDTDLIARGLNLSRPGAVGGQVIARPEYPENPYRPPTNSVGSLGLGGVI